MTEVENDREEWPGRLKEEFWTKTGTQKDRTGELEGCPQNHLGKRLAATTGATQQGPVQLGGVPHSAPGGQSDLEADEGQLHSPGDRQGVHAVERHAV